MIDGRLEGTGRLFPEEGGEQKVEPVPLARRHNPDDHGVVRVLADWMAVTAMV
jgi:hypothetical protein